ncbi:hypothetical protein KC460_04300 [Candidatus Dependentiae bacterium]|nr:hypothetical protein [Candidatus Dependentiae bacterium]
MNKHSEQREHEHNGTFLGELICHTPYAIFSVAFCLIIVSFISFATLGTMNPKLVHKGAKMLFHSFHFMHLIFAGTGVLITFFRFSKNVFKGLIVGALTTMTFCTLSDSILPYLGGRILGVNMHFHLCFVSELYNVLPFLIVGLINGIIMSRHHASRQTFYSVSSHFIHIFISSLASSFYLVSHGFTDWFHHIGFIFIFLIIAIVVPCTLSDVIVPMVFAKVDKKNEKH